MLRACPVAAFISRRSAFMSVAHACWYCSSRKVNSRRWWTLHSAGGRSCNAIAPPAVMDAHPLKAWQDPNALQRLTSAFGWMA